MIKNLLKYLEENTDFPLFLEFECLIYLNALLYIDMFTFFY